MHVCVCVCVCVCKRIYIWSGCVAMLHTSTPLKRHTGPRNAATGTTEPHTHRSKSRLGISCLQEWRELGEDCRSPPLGGWPPCKGQGGGQGVRHRRAFRAACCQLAWWSRRQRPWSRRPLRIASTPAGIAPAAVRRNALRHARPQQSNVCCACVAGGRACRPSTRRKSRP